MKKKTSLSIVSSSRAEYGILKNLISKLKKNKQINLKFIISGSHLDKKYGQTYKQIKKDKIKIDHKIYINLGNSINKNIIKNMGLYMTKVSEYLRRSNSKGIILLGDRYEMLSIASAANILNIPIIHIHGGEVTYGSYDDQVRHAITKLSYFHFVSTENAKKRVIRMGEDKKRVFLVGSLGVENLLIHRKKNNLNKIFNFEMKKNKILVSYHSQTNNIKSSRVEFMNLLNALKYFNSYTIIFTYPNHDLDSEFIIKKIKLFIKKNNNSYLFKSLGQENFYECLKSFDCIIGNSSAGIIEAPSAKIPTINIGFRQRGRDMSKSIFSIEGNTLIIKKTINKILKLKKKNLINYSNPYYKKNTAKLILSRLKSIDFLKLPPKNFK